MEVFSEVAVKLYARRELVPVSIVLKGDSEAGSTSRVRKDGEIVHFVLIDWICFLLLLCILSYFRRLLSNRSGTYKEIYVSFLHCLAILLYEESSDLLGHDGFLPEVLKFRRK